MILSLTLATRAIRRDWKLYLATSLGIILASTFFAGIIIGADTTAKLALERKLDSIAVDMCLELESIFQTEIGRWTQKPLTSANWTEAANVTRSIAGVTQAEIVSWAQYYAMTEDNKTRFTVASIQDNSRVYEGLTFVEGSSTLGVNETYVVVGSNETYLLKIGDYVNLNLWFASVVPEFHIVMFPTKLKVVGSVRLTDRALSVISSGKGNIISSSGYSTNLLVASWEKTFVRFIDKIYENHPYYNVLSTVVLIYVDRQALIDPWEIQASFVRVKDLGDKLTKANSAYCLAANSTVNNHLLCISQFEEMSSKLTSTSLITAIPVFFMAWYVAMSMSDVAINMKRRETGLLLTKGLSSGQLLKMFVCESMLIGFLSGLAALGLSILLIPLFLNIEGENLLQIPVLKSRTIFSTIIFSIAIALLAIFQPAKKASSLRAVDALREYTYTRTQEPFGGKWAWLAFTLGTYEMLSRLTGYSFIPSTGEIPLFSNISVLRSFLDDVLSLTGPILYFWGFTKIFVSASILFHGAVSKGINRFLGYLGVLASRDVKRNPTRMIALVFLSALVVGYSVSVFGMMASNQDLAEREIRLDVGADLSIALYSSDDAPKGIEQLEGIPEIQSATIEYAFSSSGFAGRFMRFRAIDPQKWGETAYYEEDWFRECDLESAFASMASDNYTIILDRGLRQGLKVGDRVSVTLGGKSHNLRIIGFFAPGSNLGYWSYVSSALLDRTGDVILSARILAKLRTEDKIVLNKITKASATIGYVSSGNERLKELTQDMDYSSLRRVQYLGATVALLSASFAVALVTFVGLRERRREISLMSIRGLSYRQITSFLLAEYVTMDAFAIVLGVIVGLFILSGNIASLTAQFFSPVNRRLIFPLETNLALMASSIVIVASTVLPITVTARKYMYKVRGVVT